ncbi:isoleucine--tRNA ligase [Sulfoacidibacillus thermotolerans]|uniref:Isoleucine--tRNA ligase n=1 Tax=Sulfoacidibacillus thermotolerans TaxID=1765684 RepID=A0A2U3D8T3_SULT2|nr:isoleucine--tRNA ligase [Sulfoacidibacillus thermotolerans]PWI57686.1 isoleucine--tRNA ligase [Sulfoacidibacillus thermotolerans]
MEFDQTLNLPQTDFPMRGNLPKREPEILEYWNQMDLYRAVQNTKIGKKKFILHDGPPYANGETHLGHALNKIIKDIIIKSRSMDGYDAPYVPGWDTHGLPIENAIIKSQKLNRHEVGVVEFRKACAEYAQKFIDIQRTQFKRFGVRGDFAHPYVTMDPSYEAEQIRVFGAMAQKGYIYKGFKPVYWCPSCETALAEAEIEYETHVSPSIYVAFPIRDGRGVIDQDVSIVIWTTTPWTIPANMGIALGPDFDYSVVSVMGRKLLIASELVEKVLQEVGFSQEPYEILATYKGRDLERTVAKHPLYDRDSLVVLGDHVTLDSGTGAVHTAPGHGMEDYLVGLQYELPIFAPLDDKARFTNEAEPFTGQFYAKANPAILAALEEQGALLAQKTLDHQYPHCWRCKNPVIYRATEQWFASIAAFREQMLEQVEAVSWAIPWGKIRLHNMIADRTDWCISRQRTWGVPIPVFYCKECGEALFNEQTIEHVAELFAEHGSQIWFAKEAAELVPEGAACTCGSKHFRKETDIMDVWFDSGSSHMAVLRKRHDLAWPADLYVEGSDQYRGWFNSSLSTSVAVTGLAPYREVLSHGFAVDGEGRKMSKSLGNGIDPMQVIEQMGADILRLWVSSVDYRSDVRISNSILKQVSEVYRKIRNTFRFLLGNLYDFTADQKLPYEQLREIDRYLLDRLVRLQEKCITAYRDYEFHVVFHAVQNFCATDLSSFYLDVAKDTLYVEAADSAARRAAQTVLYECLHTLLVLVAPILTFTADEIWRYRSDVSEPSVQLIEWTELPIEYRDDTLARVWGQILAVRDHVLQALELARQEKRIGQSLGAAVHLYGLSDEMRQRSSDEWKELLIVSEVHVHGPAEIAPKEALYGEHVTVFVTEAKGEKCPRCWHVRQDVGANPKVPDVCPRCAEILVQKGLL